MQPRFGRAVFVVLILVFLTIIALSVGLAQAAVPAAGWPAPQVAPAADVAATIVVTNSNDSGAGSLRNAIAVALPGDTITFSGDMTITLGSELVISQSLTIDGETHAVTVSGGNATRVFNVTAGHVTFAHLTIADGNVQTTDCGSQVLKCGGGIMLQNSSVVVTVTHSALYSNAADYGGGILNYSGTLTVQNSTLYSNTAIHEGGGLHNYYGALTAYGSTLSGNTAIHEGGGLYNYYGTLTAYGSTFYSNTAADFGGGLFNYTAASACVDVAAATVVNSTFSGNAAGSGAGAVYNDNGVLSIASSSIVSNTAPAGAGGGVGSWNDGATCTRVSSSLIAGNAGSDVSAIDTTQRFSSEGYNVIGTAGANVDFTLEFTQTHDLTNVVDSRVAPLADYGGPSAGSGQATWTMALLPGSPALDRGSADCPATDQRGVPRPQNGVCDSGAFELALQPGPGFLVNTAADTDDGLCELAPGTCTLREAVNAANANSDANTITFSGDMTITLGSELVISQSLSIDGETHAVTVSGGNATRVFNVTAGHVTFAHLTIADGNVRTLDCGSFVGVIQCGGGIMLQNSSVVVTVTHSTLYSNTAGYGGGILNYGGTLTAYGSTLSGNTAIHEGGGLHNYYGALTAYGSTLYSNTATYGGGLYNSTADGTCAGVMAATLVNSTFSGNAASGRGGAVYNFNGTLSIASSSIVSNTAPAGAGGGVRSWNNAATCTRVSSSLIAGNAGSDVSADSATQRFSSEGYNVIGTAGANVDFTQEFTQTHDLTNVVDSRVAPLADNGGPSAGSGQATWTMALLPGSPALDHGSAACPATDQRGVTRPRGAACDSGAYESRGFSLTKMSGDNQSAPINTAFAQPLVISVTSAYTEPVDGGVVTFSGPLTGAGINPVANTATIANGAATQSITANGTAGAYTVTVSIGGAASVTFALINYYGVYLPLILR